MRQSGLFEVEFAGLELKLPSEVIMKLLQKGFLCNDILCYNLYMAQNELAW